MRSSISCRERGAVLQVAIGAEIEIPQSRGRRRACHATGCRSRLASTQNVLADPVSGKQRHELRASWSLRPRTVMAQRFLHRLKGADGQLAASRVRAQRAPCAYELERRRRARSSAPRPPPPDAYGLSVNISLNLPLAPAATASAARRSSFQDAVECAWSRRRLSLDRFRVLEARLRFGQKRPLRPNVGPEVAHLEERHTASACCDAFLLELLFGKIFSW